MIDNLDASALHETRTFTLENDALDMLLFNFLQEFVYYKDSELLLIRAQQVQIEEKDGEYHLSAVTQGETLDRDRHEERVDVKAVTLHRFQLEKTDDGWTAMVILDIEEVSVNSSIWGDYCLATHIDSPIGQENLILTDTQAVQQ
jgi:SHS2 domain-containing protein